MRLHWLALLVVIQVRRVIGRPVRELSRAATRIAEGELDQTIRYKSGDELGILAFNFNRVTERLREYIKYIDEISDTLKEIARGNLAFELKNEYTGEKIYQMNLECNDMGFDICINAKDLLGEPEIGRRFKGSIWLQGHMNFLED